VGLATSSSVLFTLGLEIGSFLVWNHGGVLWMFSGGDALNCMTDRLMTFIR
jgi:hypothetical protein